MTPYAPNRPDLPVWGVRRTKRRKRKGHRVTKDRTLCCRGWRHLSAGCTRGTPPKQTKLNGTSIPSDKSSRAAEGGMAQNRLIQRQCICWLPPLHSRDAKVANRSQRYSCGVCRVLRNYLCHFLSVLHRLSFLWPFTKGCEEEPTRRLIQRLYLWISLNCWTVITFKEQIFSFSSNLWVFFPNRGLHKTRKRNSLQICWWAS